MSDLIATNLAPTQNGVTVRNISEAFHNVARSSGGLMLGSSWAATKPPWSASGERNGARRPGGPVWQPHRAARDATEELNRTWYERNTGRRVTDVQRRVKHSAIPWMAATLDGVVEGAEAVFEAKFMLPGRL